MLIGLTAALCTTISFLPQVIKTHKSKHTKDLSLAMLVLLAVGLMCWTTYGVLKKDPPMIMANSVTLVFVVYILAMKLRLG